MLNSVFRVIRLQNGLIACLISDSSPITASDMDVEFEESGSEVESESEVENAESNTEEDDSMPKKMHGEEQKMVSVRKNIIFIVH